MYSCYIVMSQQPSCLLLVFILLTTVLTVYSSEVFNVNNPSALWFSAPITLDSNEEDIRMYSGQRPEDACDDFMRFHNEQRYKDVLLPYLCEEADLWVKSKNTATVVVPCDGQPSRPIIQRVDVSDLPLNLHEIGRQVNIRSGYDAAFYRAMICSHTLEQGGCSLAFIPPLDWTGSRKVDSSTAVAAVAAGSVGSVAAVTVGDVVLARVQRALDLDEHRGYMLLHILHTPSPSNDNDSSASMHSLMVFRGQRPEDAVDDYLLERRQRQQGQQGSVSESTEKDSVKDEGQEEEDALRAAMLRHVCREMSDRQSDGRFSYSVIQCQQHSQNIDTQAVYSKVVGGFDVTDLPLPFSHIHLRVGYANIFYRRMICSLMVCDVEFEIYLKLRIDGEILRIMSRDPRDELQRRFEHATIEAGDIYEHMHTLQYYATKCDSILELGVSHPVSTFAFLYGLVQGAASFVSDSRATHSHAATRPRLRSVDIIRQRSVEPVHRLAAENGVQFSYEISNSLDLDLSDTLPSVVVAADGHVNQTQSLSPSTSSYSVDLTFIDTWHVYGQLKRELQKFAPVTRKWIILHDTETYGLLGESYKGTHMNSTAQAISSGFPVIELVKGLQTAITEFLKTNHDWRSEVTRKGNNGLVILKRVAGQPWLHPNTFADNTVNKDRHFPMGSNEVAALLQRPVLESEKVHLFLVTFVMDAPLSIYPPQVRYQQTIETVKSIRNHYPDAIILILDGSSAALQGYQVPGADLSVLFSDPSQLQANNKGVGETLLLQEFLQSTLFATLQPFVSMVHKLSARYVLNSSTDPATVTATANPIPASTSWNSNSDSAFIPFLAERELPTCVNAVHLSKYAFPNYETVYYSFPVALSQMLVKELKRTREILALSAARSIEDYLFATFHDLNMMCSHGEIGVRGLQAPTGKFTQI